MHQELYCPGRANKIFSERENNKSKELFRDNRSYARYKQISIKRGINPSISFRNFNKSKKLASCIFCPFIKYQHFIPE